MRKAVIFTGIAAMILSAGLIVSGCCCCPCCKGDKKAPQKIGQEGPKSGSEMQQVPQGPMGDQEGPRQGPPPQEEGAGY